MIEIDGWKVFREERFSLGFHPAAKQPCLAFPVDNHLVEYEEYYAIPQAWVDDPDAHAAEIRDTLRKARARELDEAMIGEPGSKRGWA